jgi:adenine-specific DNA-methyltransferase
MTDEQDISDPDHTPFDGMDDLDEAPDHSVPPTSPDLISENAARLAEIFPEAVTEDGVDFEVLKELLSKDLVEGEERYGLDWAGKSLARHIAAKPSTGTLRPDPDDSVEWDTTENLVIEGDNLEVLKLLQKPYAGKVKLIYIDPPYNTGKDFVYKDNFKDNIANYLEQTGQVDEEGNRLSTNTETSGRFHTDWLNMMYPRLKLARDLLSDDGVALISINDREFTHLGMICNDVFGPTNVVGPMIWRNKAGGGGKQGKNDPSKQDTKNEAFVVEHEYVLCVVRNRNLLDRFNLPLSDDERAKYSNDDEDPRGPYVLRDLEESIPTSISTLYYPITDPDGIELRPKGGRFQWRRSEKRVREELDSGEMIWKKVKDKNDSRGYRYRPKTKQYLVDEHGNERTKSARSILDAQHGVTADGTAEVRDLYGTAGVFKFPKPVGLVSSLVRSVTSDTDVAITVLDFFAGSGTTGHAVMAQNAEDGGNRRYILVQLPESLDPEVKEQKVAAEFCDELEKPRNIAELTKERLRRAAAKVKEENPDFDGDTGFRVLKLDSSNVVAWDPGTEDLEGSLEEQINPVKEDRTELDLLFEGLLKLGIDPTSPIEEREVEGARVMSVSEGRLLACLAEGLDREAAARVADEIIAWVNELGTEDDVTCLFRDSSFVGNAAKAELIARLTQAGMAENLRFI